MKSQKLIVFVGLVCLLLGASGMFLPTTGYTQADPDRVSVIAKLKYDSLASYKGGEPGLEACSIAVTGGSRLDLTTPACVAYRAFLESKVAELEEALRDRIPEARIVHRLLTVFGGASIILNKDRVKELLELPGVEAIFEDGQRQLETVASPQFIGADRVWQELGGPDQAGEGIIVAVLDSGVWPESPSFSDPDPSGNPYPPPPLRWRSTACEFGSDTPGDVPFTCNNKLIGAQRFMNTYDAFFPLLPGEFPSARDESGHGSHVLSTAAGNGGAEAAVVFDQPLAEISGVAPRAHAVAYKVCGITACLDSDNAAAVQHAVENGVDVINFSQSGPDDPYASVLSRAFLDAYEAGVVVAASAGNDGPEADTLSSLEPWVIVVGNSTADNVLAGTLDLTASNGDTLRLAGVSVTGPAEGPIVVAGDLGDEFKQCNDAPFPAGTVEGKIVICQRGGNQFLKSMNLADAGASALVIYNSDDTLDTNNLQADKHFLPAIHIDFASGQALLEFMENHDQASAVLEQGVATSVFDFPGGPPILDRNTAPGVDVVVDGSSRGGPGQRLGISKPDITAPGTQILAGGTPMPGTVLSASEGAPGLYMVINGTSMASPHIAGAAALLRDLHPDWTPGQIQSALMTTARQEVLKEDATTPADPFDRGSGRVDLRRAFEPGLTFVGPSAQDFRDHEKDLWNVNYPSLYHPLNPGRITVERTVADQPGGKKNWKTRVSAPPDVDIDVPKHVKIKRDGTTTFDITVDARAVPTGEVRHANLRLESGDDEANFPITIVKSEPGLPFAKHCEPTAFRRGETTECTITVTNSATADPLALSIRDELPRELKLEGDVDGAVRLGKRELAFAGVLDGAVGPEVSVEEAASPFGYLPLASLGVEPLDDDLVGDETIANFDVPPFLYGGETYTRIGLASNGFAVVGGGVVGLTPKAQTMPDPKTPNNVIAPFWTDLSGDGTFYVATVDPDNSGTEWLVLEWENAEDFDIPRGEYSFQIWIQVGTGQEAIFMVYERVDGDGSDDFGFGVGAENKFGSSGVTLTDLPVVGVDLRVVTTPIVAGTHTITFTAKGAKKGNWQNCAEMESSAFPGTAIVCSEGEVRGK